MDYIQDNLEQLFSELDSYSGWFFCIIYVVAAVSAMGECRGGAYQINIFL